MNQPQAPQLVGLQISLSILIALRPGLVATWAYASAQEKAEETGTKQGECWMFAPLDRPRHSQHKMETRTHLKLHCPSTCTRETFLASIFSRNTYSPTILTGTRSSEKKMSNGAVDVGNPSADYAPRKVVHVHFHNFCRLSAVPNKQVNSETFYFQGLEWYLLMYPGGQNKDKTSNEESHIGVYLLPSTNSWTQDATCTIKFTIAITKMDATWKSGWRTFSKNGYGRGWDEFAKRKNVLDNGRNNDTLTFKVTLEG
eukprot:CAMPEP_0198113570 /NCGR_PEP_ID=MMETSP1442-20131203/5202_1 /TAXON_ID= /ORGANISM="Craspedostauros australis, Strain CCMP3328" /LENGTH=255 /DNA_ID=CAMNT_0043770699 /DNA_START=879 /DNA_END=1646 /DNA_ORIENTATION=-